MKLLKLTTRECDMLDYVIERWFDNGIHTNIPLHTYRNRPFVAAEMRALQERLKDLYWSQGED